MKLGDIFVHKDGSRYMFIGRMQPGDDCVSILNLNNHKVLPMFEGKVNDCMNITREEFRDILCLRVVEEYPLYTNVYGEPLFPEITYKMGDVFELHSDSKYMLVQCESHKCCLVDVGGGGKGNRYDDPIKVKNPCKVTEAELKQMCGDREFTLTNN